VAEMPRSLRWQLVELIGGVSGHDLNDRVQAVKLVGHRGRKRRVRVELERGGKVVVGLGVIDSNVAETSYDTGRQSKFTG
jgi:hypothetical protein